MDEQPAAICRAVQPRLAGPLTLVLDDRTVAEDLAQNLDIA